MPEYQLPDVGEGLTEAEIVTWKVKVGDVDRDQRHRRRDRDRQVAGRAALAVRRHRDRRCSCPRARPSRSARRSSRSASRRPCRPTEATLPGRPTAAGGRARTLGEIDLSNPAATGGGEGESLVGRNKADRGPMRRPRKVLGRRRRGRSADPRCSCRRAFAPGGARAAEVVEADEPAVPAVPAAAEPRRAGAAGDVRALAKPPVRKLAKDLGVDLTTLAGDRRRTARSPARTSQAALERRWSRVTARRRASLDHAASGSAASRSRASAR